MKIRVEKAEQLKVKPDEDKLGFENILLIICLLWTMTKGKDGMMQE